MSHELKVKLFEIMKREPKNEIVRKFNLDEIGGAIDIASEILAAHDREWFGMTGTCWEIEDRNEKRRDLRKLLQCAKAKANLVYASIAA